MRGTVDLTASTTTVLYCTAGRYGAAAE